MKYSIAAAQRALPKVVAACEAGEPVEVARRGQTVAYLISKARYDAHLETMELLSNPAFMETIHEYESGKTTWTAMADLSK